MNQIRVVDVIAHAKEREKAHRAKYEQLKFEHDCLVEQARQHWFYRLFPFMFNPRDHGYGYGLRATIEGMDMRFSELAAREYKSLFNQATYYHNCGINTMTWPTDTSLYESGFYNWCHENNIPY